MRAKNTFTYLMLALMAAVLVGCGGDSKKSPPPGADKEVPTADVDMGGDPEPGPEPKDPAPKDPAPKDPAPKDPAPKDPAPKDPAPTKSSDAGGPADAGYGHLVIHFKTDKYIPMTEVAEAKAACKVSAFNETVVIDKDSMALANVACWLDNDDVKVHPSYADAAKADVEFDNVDCRFAPHIATIVTGQKLVIGNKDAFGHNSKVDPFNNEAHNPIIAPGKTYELSFQNPESVPVSVSCNIHPWMKGYVLVKPHPLVGVSDKDGTLIIKNIPAGEHEFRMWHETGYVKEAKVDGKDVAWKKGRTTFKIPDGGTLEMTAVVASDSLN